MKRSSKKNDDHIGSKLPRLQNSTNDNGSTTASNNDRIKVCVRVRPLKPIELETNTKSIIDVIDKSLLVFDPYIYDEDNNQYEYHGKRYKEIGKKANKNLQFNFDRVFNDEENNLSVYTETTKDMVEALLAGYNCSVFAYGSTGSGKTHTMLGSTNDPGVIFFTTMDLYKQIDEEKDQNLELKISYFEIYNEIIYDLLDPTSNQPLSVLENANKSITVKNLSIHQPKDAQHLIEMLEYGNKNRKQHPTDANAESSRSHAVFQITLQRKDFSDDQDMSIQVSKMSLIDLAGSERASNAYKTYRSNSLHREGGNINKSLLSLGNCIHALTSNKKDVYVPYRSSKLTMILRDSLGGNCKTLMIATISPSANQYEETHNTLIYAERAQGIQLFAQKNNITVGVQPRDYKRIIENMTREKAKLLNTIEELKQKYQNHVECVPKNPINTSKDSLAKLNSVKNTLDDHFQQRIELRSKLLDCEHNIKMLDLRLLFREYENERAKLFNVIEEENRSEQTKSLHSIYGQKLHYSNLKISIEEQVKENETKIMEFENDLIAATDNDIIVRSYFIENHCIVKKKDMDMFQEHSKKMFEEFYSKYNAFHELTEDTFNYIYKSYHILNGLGKLSEEMDEKFQSIAQKINGKKSVIWRDNIDSTSMIKTKAIIKLFSLPVYDGVMNNTPENKRNLVAIRDITPRLLRPIQNNHNGGGTPKHIGTMNHQGLGNTITKSRNVAMINTPGQQQQQNSSRYYNNNYKSPKYFNQPWPRSISSSQRKQQRQFGYRNNNNFNYNNDGLSNSRTNSENFSYNPNFRPKFRF
uniref:Kinesin-like protein n=1 Tax=Dermatophagoides pteronyssinus TaxID=6956 RepID=A0A6P6XXQ2_DERPT|nr:kinesin-like protein KIF18A [Dermatophagoides pteronyssinus]